MARRNGHFCNILLEQKELVEIKHKHEIYDFL